MVQILLAIVERSTSILGQRWRLVGERTSFLEPQVGWDYGFDWLASSAHTSAFVRLQVRQHTSPESLVCCAHRETLASFDRGEGMVLYSMSSNIIICLAGCCVRPYRCRLTAASGGLVARL